MTGENGKEDVLVVAAWEQGMSEAVVFTQRFLPKARGGFAVYGPVSLQSELEPEQLSRPSRGGFCKALHNTPKVSAGRHAFAQQQL